MGQGNKAEMLIAICAVLTSVIALFVAWDQGRVMRAQQHGSVYPVVQMVGFVSRVPDHVSLGLNISNSGVGPALIESVTMLKDKTPLDSLTAYRDRLPAGYDISWTGLTGRALAPGAQVTALEISWPRESITDGQLYQIAAEWGELEMEVCYCSVFDRCWLARDLDRERAVRVPACERGTSDIFEALQTTGSEGAPPEQPLQGTNP
jgi:hypothetical protein